MPANDGNGRPLGILGGIFDPPHNGHLAVASFARDYFGLSEVLFVPSGTPPHKSTATPAIDRLAMLKRAIVNEPTFKIWDAELRRKGTSYTIDTLEELSRHFPGRPVYFIVGSDNLHEIQTWRRYRDVLRLVTLCVTHRPGRGVASGSRRVVRPAGQGRSGRRSRSGGVNSQQSLS